MLTGQRVPFVPRVAGSALVILAKRLSGRGCLCHASLSQSADRSAAEGFGAAIECGYTFKVSHFLENLHPGEIPMDRMGVVATIEWILSYGIFTAH
ncbi:hypothetical protein [Paracoccus siganidrum]|uniref:hypothetical protein n=1 Tax=Paracoccus siganidrum TaxID=1276757 RepID=UPI001472E638|nr:hypothetical protein [Paracoccus siganidrum]